MPWCSLLIGFLAGVELALVPPLYSPRIAAPLTQAMYDCGVRLSGVKNMTISGGTIQSHRWTLCGDDRTSGIVFENNKLTGNLSISSH